MSVVVPDILILITRMALGKAFQKIPLSLFEIIDCEKTIIFFSPWDVREVALEDHTIGIQPREGRQNALSIHCRGYMSNLIRLNAIFV